MKAVGKPKRSLPGTLIAFIIIAGAVAAGLHVLQIDAEYPSTDDASLDADMVHVAAAVGGRIIKIPVVENGKVMKGDLLFQIDPVPYQLAVEEAEAELQFAEASLESRRRVIATEKSNATIASGQTQRAETNLAIATRTTDRLQPLALKGYVPFQQYDQAQTTRRDANTSLLQAREQETAAFVAVGTDADALASVRARQASLAIARRHLEDTTVIATHDGRIAGLTISTGEMVAPTQSIFTLINTEEWFAVANFRETQLKAIAVGDCVTAFSMIDRTTPIKGFVEGIGWGVLDQDRINLPRSVPYVERSLNWVRVAQRFPVRIRLENPPEALMRLGASASVQVKHGAACR